MKKKLSPSKPLVGSNLRMRVLSFSEMLKALKDSPAVSHEEEMCVIRVHDDLDVARSIAEHLFENPDPSVVMAVYDRLVLVLRKADAGVE